LSPSLIGGVVDLVGTGLFAIPLIMYMIKFNLVHAAQAQFQAVMTAEMHANLWLTIVQSLPGAAGSILAGYAAAWFAKHDELLNGAFSACFCVALGLYALLVVPTPIPLYDTF